MTKFTDDKTQFTVEKLHGNGEEHQKLMESVRQIKWQIKIEVDKFNKCKHEKTILIPHIA